MSQALMATYPHVELDEEVIKVLTFWFGTEYWKRDSRDPPNCTAHYDDLWQGRWFAKEHLTSKMDIYLKENFGSLVERAIATDELDHWKSNQHSCLALIVVLDQFTRNIYRGTKRAWSGDVKALLALQDGIIRGFDKMLKPVPRAMYYMPYLHAEDRELSKLSFQLYSALYQEAKEKKSLTEHCLGRFKMVATRHDHAVQQFGRYPERNRILGRTPTSEEEAYLHG
eukprot:TRINITY_DN25137_c0_g1_i1.p1 TRINITY_DN25137_c0_g1~~TRINITY_DN25137_c0_g1_i1.p1  ORF type:complete len:226 (-),score=21.45 TRINITY_DN25137_c0_g1_i1:30-707(-)